MTAARRPLAAVAVIGGAVANAALLWFFHRRFWYAPDEGNYAHVAQRILAGEVLHRDVQDIHPGYIDFLNAGALRVFGLDLLSLRYPLGLAAFVAATLVLLSIGRTRPLLGAVASIALTALGPLQFLDPTAHWYCLCLAIAIAVAAEPVSDRRLIVIGVLLGTLALFRQLSGAFIAIGATAYLLRAAAAEARGKEVALERLVLALGAAVLAVYLARTTDVAGWLLFGVWPLLLLAWLWWTAATPNREALRILGRLAAGASLAALPLLLYHLAHGSLGAWWRDVVVGPAALVRLPFLRQSGYSWMIAAALDQLLSGTPRGALNGIYWLAALLLAAINGAIVLRRLVRSRELAPLPVLATFHALVSVHYQIPIYLAYSAGLSLAALAFAAQRPRAQLVVGGAAAFLAAVALRYQAGQPLSRGLAGTIAGQRVALVPATLPRCSLWIDPAERARYLELVGLIQRESAPGDALLALPSHAELYFLADRRNPLRFYNSALGIPDAATLADVERRLLADPPKLVVFDPTDKYNTPFSQQLMQAIKVRYTLLRRLHDLEIYRQRD